MNRRSVNPWDWGLQFSLDQGEITEGATRHLRCSGQVAVVPDDSEHGVAVVSPNEMRGQIEAALANVDAVLTAADMSRENITHVRVFTTDVDQYLEHYDVYVDWVGAADRRPPQTLLGIQRLFMPELMVEIEVTASA